MSKKIAIITYGCTANKNHAEIMETLLKTYGFDIVKNENDADVIIINSCIVKNASESKIRFQISKFFSQFPNKKLIIAGCMPQAEYSLLRKLAPHAALIGPNNVLDILLVVKSILNGKRLDKIDMRYESKFVSPARNKSNIQIIEISQGCLGNCSFCITKLAKGPLHSYPSKEIVDYIKAQVAKGKKKIFLTAQDTGCYGRDINTNLVELLKEVVKIEEDFKVRVGMMNPKYCYEMLDDLIDVFQNGKIIKFLHVPVQSGSNKVLKEMNRPYNVEVFEEIVDKFRKAIPKIKIATDIIVCFPTETDADFEQTVELLKKTKLDKVNVSKFYPRPYTKAKEMKQLPSQIKKERSVKLYKLLISAKSR